jgi:hypothetical protein
MKRILVACAALAFGAGLVSAASPRIDAAIKTIQGVGGDAAKMALFCDLVEILDDAGEAEDPALEKRVDDLLAKLGQPFSAAWEEGSELDEKSADGVEFSAAVDALSEKCP